MSEDRDYLLRKCGLCVDEIIQEQKITDEEFQLQTFESILKLIELKKLIKYSDSAQAKLAKKTLNRIIKLHKSIKE